MPCVVFAQDAPPSATQRGFTSLLLFWSGAGVLMFIIGRIVFREHLGELRSLRMLIDKIGPFFPEFDVTALNKWVRLGAPHVFKAWRDGDLDVFRAHVTDEFAAEEAARRAAQLDEGQFRETRLGKVLKIHPLGLYMYAEGNPPKGVELVLRVELRGIDCCRNAAGEIVAGAKEQRQIQYFWTLRHDGRQWRLHHIEVAEQDRVDLRDKPTLPPIMEWKRPKETNS